MSNASIQSEHSSQHPGAQAEMDAFDALPPDIRQMIRDAVVPVGAVAASQAIGRVGAAMVARTLTYSLAKDMPAIVDAAWGPGHPERPKFEKMAAAGRIGFDEACHRVQRRRAFEMVASNRRPGYSG